MTVSAVLFDLDGTLVDSLPGLTRGVNCLMAAKGLAPFTEKEIEKYIGRGVPWLIECIFSARGIPFNSGLAAAAARAYADFMVDSPDKGADFYPGALDAVKSLRAAGMKTAIVSNKIRSMVDRFIAEEGLAGIFDCFVAGDDTLRPKPAPDMLFLACKKLGVGIDEVVMVGDSRTDALSARNAGIPVYLVETGYNEGVPVREWASREGIGKVFADVPAAAAAILELADAGTGG